MIGCFADLHDAELDLQGMERALFVETTFYLDKVPNVFQMWELGTLGTSKPKTSRCGERI